MSQLKNKETKIANLKKQEDENYIQSKYLSKSDIIAKMQFHSLIFLNS